MPEMGEVRKKNTESFWMDGGNLVAFCCYGQRRRKKGYSMSGNLCFAKNWLAFLYWFFYNLMFLNAVGVKKFQSYYCDGVGGDGFLKQRDQRTLGLDSTVFYDDCWDCNGGKSVVDARFDFVVYVRTKKRRGTRNGSGGGYHHIVGSY